MISRIKTTEQGTRKYVERRLLSVRSISSATSGIPGPKQPADPRSKNRIFDVNFPGSSMAHSNAPQRRPAHGCDDDACNDDVAAAAAAAAAEPVLMQTLRATPLLSQLGESDAELQQHAIKELLQIVDDCWPEIASLLPRIEELYEDQGWDEASRQHSALLAAKVLFHLGEIDEALMYAMMAGDLFVGDDSSEFSRVLRARCLDKYVARRQLDGESEKASTTTTTTTTEAYAEDLAPNVLEAVVNQSIWACVDAGEYNEALGIALEALRLDAVSAVLGTAAAASAASATQSAVSSLLEYAIVCCQELISKRWRREKILRHLVEWQNSQPEDQRDEMILCRCLMLLRDASGVTQILQRQLRERKESLAYQIAFDLWDHDDRALVAQVRNDIVAAIESRDAVAAADRSRTNEHAILLSILNGRMPSELYLDFMRRRNCFDKRLLKSLLHRLVAPPSLAQSAILFAYGLGFAGTADDTFLRENVEWLMRTANWTKFSATATLGVAHIRNADQAFALLAPYLSSSHQGSMGSSAYSEGGALYALGLIAASGVEAHKVAEFRRYLLEALRNAGTNEVIQHGACLALGLCALADGERETNNVSPSESESFQELRNVLYMDSALAGEAAALGMGMALVGTGDAGAIEQMLEYARETQHQKIIRGLAIGLALVVYGCEEEAEPLIHQMLASEDGTIRYGAVFAIGLAYCGSGNNAATKRLLHAAVSDVNDDVRRAAVLNLGFIFARDRDQLPQVVSLLAESYNPHVRYGAAMALAIGCACSGNQDAAKILQKLSNDTVDFVRQGALIALAMLYQHHNQTRSAASAALRKRLDTIAKDKHEEILTKFGAVLAMGIIDSGGRNAEIALLSRLTQSLRPTAVAGMALFMQYWYWYPMVPFLTLSLRPAACVFVNQGMQLMRLKLQVEGDDERLAQFTYAPMFEEDDNKIERKREKMVLSVTAKADRLKRIHPTSQQRNDQESEHGTRKPAKSNAAAPTRAPEQMDVIANDVVEEPKMVTEQTAGDASRDHHPEAKAHTPKATNALALAAVSLLENPARVLTAHEGWVSLDGDDALRWRPLRRGAGIVLVEREPVRDSAYPDAPDGVVERLPPLAPPVALANGARGRDVSGGSGADAGVSGIPEHPVYDDEDREPATPEPFEYTSNTASAEQGSNQKHPPSPPKSPSTHKKNDDDDKDDAAAV